MSHLVKLLFLLSLEQKKTEKLQRWPTQLTKEFLAGCGRKDGTECRCRSLYMVLKWKSSWKWQTTAKISSFLVLGLLILGKTFFITLTELHLPSCVDNWFYDGTYSTVRLDFLSAMFLCLCQKKTCTQILTSFDQSFQTSIHLFQNSGHRVF